MNRQVINTSKAENIFLFIYLSIYWAWWDDAAAFMGKWPKGTRPRSLSALRNSQFTPAVKLREHQDWTGEATAHIRMTYDSLTCTVVCTHVLRGFPHSIVNNLKAAWGEKTHNVVL